MADFNAKECAESILKNYPGIRDSVEYKGMEDYIIDRTKSCDKREQIAWMFFYMREALNKAKRAKRISDPNSREGVKYETAVQFIVAYDLI